MGLFNSTVLDVIIGLIFVYLLLSILCTAANEWVSALTRRRAKILKKGIHQLLSNQGTPTDNQPDAFLREFYEHPLLRSMKHDKHHPAYISPRTFTAVVLDIINLPETDETLANLASTAQSWPDGEVKQSLVPLIKRAKQRGEPSQQAIEAWFNDAMDRVTGWYKRRTQLWTIFIALALTIVANADTVQITRRLWTDPVVRGKIVEAAKSRSQKAAPTISVEYEDEGDPTIGTITRIEGEGNKLTDDERQMLGQLIGWHGVDPLKGKTERLLGWLLTILALSMGAPFWFDLLNKIMNVRYTGKSPDEAAKTAQKEGAEKRA